MVLDLDQYDEERASFAWMEIRFQTSAFCLLQPCSYQLQSHNHRRMCHCWKTTHLEVLIRRPKHHPPMGHSYSLLQVDRSFLMFHQQKCWNSAHFWHSLHWIPETRYQGTLGNLQRADSAVLAPRKGQEEFRPTKIVPSESLLLVDQRLLMQI